MLYKDLLRFRQAWLGFAMCLVVFYHLPMDIPIWLLQQIKTICYCGVDICLFASGIGCYFSLDANSDVGSFMKRRVCRLLPTYLPFIIIWLAFQWLQGSLSLQMAIGNILCVQNFTGLKQDFNWYISAIFLLYFLSPYLKIIIDRTSVPGKLLFLLLLIVASIPFWGSHVYIITVTRIPIFYLGMIFAQICKQGMKYRHTHLIWFAISSLVGFLFLLWAILFAPDFLWSFGLFWYPFILMAPPICIFCSLLLSIVEEKNKSRFFFALLTKIGNYSFEIYLVHIFLFEIVSACIDYFQLHSKQDPIYYFAIALLPIGCVMLRNVSNYISFYIGKAGHSVPSQLK